MSAIFFFFSSCYYSFVCRFLRCCYVHLHPGLIPEPWFVLEAWRRTLSVREALALTDRRSLGGCRRAALMEPGRSPVPASPGVVPPGGGPSSSCKGVFLRLQDLRGVPPPPPPPPPSPSPSPQPEHVVGDKQACRSRLSQAHICKCPNATKSVC